MISKGFYFSSIIEKNKGDRDFKRKHATPANIHTKVVCSPLNNNYY